MAQSSVQTPHRQDYDAQTPRLTPHAPVTFVKTIRHEKFTLNMHVHECVLGVIMNEFSRVT